MIPKMRFFSKFTSATAARRDLLEILGERYADRPSSPVKSLSTNGTT
jgi:hypothetical protein